MWRWNLIPIMAAMALSAALASEVLAQSSASAPHAAPDPVLQITVADDCRSPDAHSLCQELVRTLEHAATRRRLDRFSTTIGFSDAESPPGVSLFAPSGEPVMRWPGFLDQQRLMDVLSIAEHARGPFNEWMLARASGVESEVLRTEVILRFALGDRAGGDALLGRMAESSPANRQLAEVFAIRVGGVTLTSEVMDALRRVSGNGANDYVKFQALMLLGDIQRSSARDDARASYIRALELAPEGSEHIARSALQRLDEETAPLIGLGRSGAVVAGRRTVQLREPLAHTRRVDFLVNGQKAAASGRRPFMAVLHLGRLPAPKTIEAVEYDGDGAVLRKSRVIVNGRTDEPVISITSPATDLAGGRVVVKAEAGIPRGQYAESAVIEWNGDIVERFVAPPFETVVEVAPGEAGVLRAAIQLSDGTIAEDVRLLNSGSVFSDAVHLVEVPVYADRFAQLEGVRVREGGSVMRVDRIISPQDAPLRLALLLDTSSSMLARILDVQEAALQFVESEVTARDRILVIRFGSGSRISLPTADRNAIEREILNLRIGGTTSLYDALVDGILQLPAAGSRRALVVFSDGIDNSSTFSANDVAELARRNGVPVYVLYSKPDIRWDGVANQNPFGRNAGTIRAAMQIALNGREQLVRISSSTGGQFFELTTDDDAAEIWGTIGDDLARQFLLIYKTAAGGAASRTLEIIDSRGTRLRAPGDVYVARGVE